MKQNSEKQLGGLPEIGLGLDDFIRRDARRVIHQAVEAELAQLRLARDLDQAGLLKPGGLTP